MLNVHINTRYAEFTVSVNDIVCNKTAYVEGYESHKSFIFNKMPDFNVTIRPNHTYLYTLCGLEV